MLFLSTLTRERRVCWVSDEPEEAGERGQGQMLRRARWARRRRIHVGAGRISRTGSLACALQNSILRLLLFGVFAGEVADAAVDETLQTSRSIYLVRGNHAGRGEAGPTNGKRLVRRSESVTAPAPAKHPTSLPSVLAALLSKTI